MADKVWIRRLSFNLSREIRWWLAVSLTFGLLLSAAMQESRAAANSQFVSASAQDQDRIAARRKFEEGEALRAQGTVESLRLAVKKYEEALLLWRAIGDRTGEAVTLYHIGYVYGSLDEKQKALNYFNQALPVFRATGDRDGEAAKLNNIGLVYYSLGEKQKALDYFNQALPLWRVVGDRAGEATTLSLVAWVDRDLGKLVEARTRLETSLNIIESLRTKVVSRRNSWC